MATISIQRHTILAENIVTKDALRYGINRFYFPYENAALPRLLTHVQCILSLQLESYHIL